MALNADTLIDRLYLKSQITKWRVIAFVFAVLAILVVVERYNPRSPMEPTKEDILKQLNFSDTERDQQRKALVTKALSEPKVMEAALAYGKAQKAYYDLCDEYVMRDESYLSEKGQDRQVFANDKSPKELKKGEKATGAYRKKGDPTFEKFAAAYDKKEAAIKKLEASVEEAMPQLSENDRERVFFKVRDVFYDREDIKALFPEKKPEPPKEREQGKKDMIPEDLSMEGIQLAASTVTGQSMNINTPAALGALPASRDIKMG